MSQNQHLTRDQQSLLKHFNDAKYRAERGGRAVVLTVYVCRGQPLVIYTGTVQQGRPDDDTTRNPA